jgi:lipoate-protein ligase A
MRVVRGALPDVDADRQVTSELTRLTERTGKPTLRVWTPPRQLAFGRRDSTADGYQRARRIATEHGYHPLERSVGGSAVAYTGTTVAFAIAIPTETDRSGIEDRYRETTAALSRALETAGAAVIHGEPSGSFCPGEHSLQGDGKIAGIAQRVRRKSALVGGCVIASRSDAASISRVLKPVYAALGIPFDPAAVGSVEGAGGTADIEQLVQAIETTFVGDREAIRISAGTTLGDGPQ